MKNRITASLMIGCGLLTACATTPKATPAPKSTPPMLASQTALSTKEIKLTPPEFRADAPDRYVVKRGDTLWNIASRFLKSPARWKDIWHANPQIKNPNRIYPGDVISYKTVGGARKLQVAGSTNPVRGMFTGRRTADGRPIYDVSPTIREESIMEPIPAVPKEIVHPFVTKNRVVEPGFSQEYPYVVGQADGGFIALTGRDKIYARSEDGFEHGLYDVFREARPVNDPESGELLGVEAVYVGQLKMVEGANDDGIATFMQTDTVNPLYPNDILLPTESAKIGEDLSFMPKLPELDDDETAVVIRPLGASSAYTGSQFSTLLINVGEEDGVETGDVFKIVRAKAQTGVGREGELFRLPDYEVAVGMVYKTGEETSYLLVMNASDVVYPGDRLVRP